MVLSDGVEARLAAYLLRGLDQEVVIAGTAAEAELCLVDRLWSVVILDTTLPDRSGFDLLAALGEMSFDGVVLMLSAAPELALKVRALDEGADDYVVRPYEPAEFLARVRAMLRRSRRRAGRAESNRVRVGEVELDVQGMEVLLPGGRRVRLTPHEMRVLHYLMTHPHRVVTYAELAAGVFGATAAAAYEAVIGVYVRRVRQKIEPASGPSRAGEGRGRSRYIETVRGSGYRFAAP